MNDERLLALAEEFSEATVVLRSGGGTGEDQQAFLRLLKLTVDAVDGAVCASISDRHASTMQATDDTASLVDSLQSQLGEGPCLDAAHNDDTLFVVDVTSEDRWPAWASAVREATPIRSALAFPLRGSDAALNVFGEAPEFSPEAIATATVLAAHLSSLVALAHAESRGRHLKTALQSSRVIGEAIGIIMFATKTTADEAFQTLTVASQNLNRKVRDLAAHIVDTGTLPTR